MTVAGTPSVESSEERLTRQFYEWEMWGRGWRVWDQPVDLEPPFEPFFGHFVQSGPGRPPDDGRKPTLLSSFTDRFLALMGSQDESLAPLPAQSDAKSERRAYVADEDSSLVELQIALPPDIKVSKDAAEQFLLGLGHVSRPLSFEIVATSESIQIQIVGSRSDRSHLRSQLQAYFPEAIVHEPDRYLADLWDETGNQETVVVDFGLSHEFMRPLRSFARFDPDPLTGLVGAMTDLADGEVALLQVLFTPVENPWPESILRAVSDGEGDSFFADDGTIFTLAGQKIARPLFAVLIRIAAQSARHRRAWRIAQRIGKGLRPFADPQSNELIPLENDGYDDLDHAQDLVARRSRRCGMLLNSDELVSLVHLPSASVRSVKLKREMRKTKAAPTLSIGHHLFLGENEHAGRTVRVTQSPEQRVRHTYLIGASGTGKSTLLLNMIVQDIEKGEGLAVLDPHGDLIDHILGLIPEHRTDDVVLLDPSDEEYPVGFNILSAHSELERNLLASDLGSVFRRLSTSWGDQMTAVLGNAILAFLESSEGGTLADLRRFLVEADYRSRFLTTVRDQEVVYYWRKEYPLLSGRPQGPILTRLDTFLRPKLIRHMVSQRRNRLDFGGIMNGRKIFLAKLSQGLIGEENSHLLGTLLVSKLNQTAMSRQEISASQRKHFYLYVDEFHHFVTPSMAAILSGARKYHLGLILAHQELNQLWSRDKEVASAVISNPYTRVCFRLGDFDAKKLDDGFSHFNAKDLQNLGVGQALCRMERSEYDFNLKTVPLAAPDPAVAQTRREAIIDSSRERNAMPREEVEALLRRDLPAVLGEEPARQGKPAAPTPTRTPPEPAAEPVAASIAMEPPTLPKDGPLPAGRGGRQHQYLQQLIKRWAEDRGYRATIEKAILDGLGSVDVALEKDELSIACEISITTLPEHELGNIQKCLAGGFRHVVVLATERKALKKIATAAKVLDAAHLERVHFFLPEELFAFLEECDASQSNRLEETVRGYRVKVKLKPVTEAEERAKKQVIARTVLQAMQRLKQKTKK